MTSLLEVIIKTTSKVIPCPEIFELCDRQGKSSADQDNSNNVCDFYHLCVTFIDSEPALNE